MDAINIQTVIMGICGFMMIYYFDSINSTIKEVTKQLSNLHTKIAVVVERIDKHDREIVDLKIGHKELSDRIHD